MSELYIKLRNSFKKTTGEVTNLHHKAFLRHAAQILFCFLSGFFLAGARFFTYYLPLGAAVSASFGTSLASSAAALFGTIVGAAVFGSEFFLKYMLAAMLAFGLRMLFSTLKSNRFRELDCGLSAFFAMLLISSVWVIKNGFLPYDIVFWIVESIFAGAAAYFYAVTFALAKNSSLFRAKSSRELISLCVTFCTFLLAGQAMHFWGISLSSVSAVLFILCACRGAGAQTGCTVGFIFGFSVSIVSGGLSADNFHLVAAYAAGGLIAGAFAHLGRLWSCSLFLSCTTLVTMYIAPSSLSNITLNTVIACAVFCFIPKNLLTSLCSLLTAEQKQPKRIDVKQHYDYKFKGVFGMLDELAAMMDEFSRRISRKNIEPDTSPQFLAKKTDEINSRKLIYGQFSAMSKAMLEAAQSVLAETDIDGNLSEKLHACARECGFDCLWTSASYDKNERLIAELELSDLLTRQDSDKLAAATSALCGKQLIAQTFEQADTTHVTLREKPVYKVSFARAEQAKSGEDVCGDTVHILTETNRFIGILSDGMGCGKAAAIDSIFASTAAERLIKCGIMKDTAAEILNNVMQLRPDDESFATLDIAAIDLYTGDGELLKSGAAPSFIKSGGKVYTLSCSAPPVGILISPSFDEYKFTLSDSDICILVSDGVLSGFDSPRLIEALLSGFGRGDISELAREILLLGSAGTPDMKNSDDMSVLVMKLEKNDV